MENLLSSFAIPGREDWLEQIRKDLKTDDPQKILMRNLAGISFPAEFDEIPEKAFHELGNRAPVNPDFAASGDWLSMVSAGTDNLSLANRQIIRLLESGAGSVQFTGFGISNQEELRLCLKGILPEIAPISFLSGEAAPALLFMYLDELKRMNCDPTKIQGSLGWDPLTDFIAYGSFSSDISEVISIGKSLTETAQRELPAYHIYRVNGAYFHNAGASVVDELAVVCSIISDVVVKMGDVDPTTILRHLRVNMGIGTQVTLEIAKLRALRILWSMVCKGFGVSEVPALHLETETSFRNKTTLDPYNNLLRCTLESFSAVAGGSNEHQIHAYNRHYNEHDEDAALLALNIHHLLREESRLDKVLDPLAGAPYIEHLTEKLVEESWKKFLEWEDRGGYVASVRAGVIQDSILAQRAKTEKEIRTRKKVLVGVNRFANASYSDISTPLAIKDPLLGLPTVKTIEPYFEAASFESVRKLLNLGTSLKACIFGYGDAKMSRLRADFSSDFLACGGIQVETTDASVALSDRFFSQAAEKAEIWCFCSSDDSYVQMLDQFRASGISGKTILVAGNPSSPELETGTDEVIFIYTGCDAVATLHDILEAYEQQERQ